MEITFFCRNRKCGDSIRRSFHPIIEELSKTNNVKYLEVPSHRADLISILRNILYVYKHRNIKGVNHITGDIHYCVIALWSCYSVLTIHDVGFLDNRLNRASKLKLCTKYILWLLIPVLMANRVVCISNTTLKTLKKYTPKRFHKKILVINNPLNSEYRFHSKIQRNMNKPIILHIGTSPNKNIERVIEAISTIKCKLEIVGRLNKSQIELLQYFGIEYCAEDRITDSEIIRKYLECDIVSFPSLYEGFGLPIIEGQATGGVVLTSNIAPMTEVAGDGACFVDPSNVEEIKSGFINIISNGTYREHLKSKGYENVERFNPKNIAEQYLKIYKTLNQRSNKSS